MEGKGGYHKLLERQLRAAFGGHGPPPGLGPLLDAVDASYRSSDEDRRLLERSLDLTSQELNQRYVELRRQHMETRLLFDHVPAMIVFKDDADRIVRLNEVAAKHLGARAEELEGKDMYALVPAEEAEALKEMDRKVMETGEPCLGVVVPSPGKDGTPRWVRVDKAPYRDPDGHVQGIIHLGIEVTELRRAQRELEEAYARLQETDRARTNFLNAAAHELGTPLTPLKLQLRIVQERLGTQVSPAQARSLAILERNVDRVVALVQDLLDGARLHARQLRLNCVPTDVGWLATEAAGSFADLAAQAGVDLAFAAEPGLIVEADPQRLSQVLDNLIANAIKFTPRGGRVCIGCTGASDGRVEVRVKDTGIGIEPGEVDRLFQPFSQLETGQPHAGTGLGLYISKGIAAQLGGTIRVESAGAGRGSTFILSLPLAPGPSLSSAPLRDLPGDQPPRSPDARAEPSNHGKALLA